MKLIFNKYFASIRQIINNYIDISSENYGFKQFKKNYSKIVICYQ